MRNRRTSTTPRLGTPCSVHDGIVAHASDGVTPESYRLTSFSDIRRSVGVVTQRTEILAGTLAENVTLFEPVPRRDVEAAIVELGLEDWVAGLSAGLDTLLGPGGTTLSAGEEQLVAFARLLVRDVRVVEQRAAPQEAVQGRYCAEAAHRPGYRRRQRTSAR